MEDDALHPNTAPFDSEPAFEERACTDGIPMAESGGGLQYQKHCPGCYGEKLGLAVCPHCGYDESAPRSPLFLPHGIIIGGQFRVGRVLGKPGGFGITYIGWDVFLQQRVAIKEYLPRDLAARTADSLDVQVHTEADRARFNAGRERFLRESRIVARLDHPNIVRVRSYFNANGTAYLVMDYYEGIALGEYLATVRGHLAPAVALDLVKPILRGLQYVHERRVIHRDVKPANIYLAAEGKPLLLDFGAALYDTGPSEDSRAVVLTEGYAPLEQYQRRSPQGPFTDVYGAGATLYRMITGQSPPMALDRLGHDPLPDNLQSMVPAGLREPLRRALAVRPEDRYANATEFLAALDAVSLDAPGDAADLAAVYEARHHLPDLSISPMRVTEMVETRVIEQVETAAPTVTARPRDAGREVRPAPPAPVPLLWRAGFAVAAAIAAAEFLVIMYLLR